MKGYDLIKCFPDFTIVSGHKGLDQEVSTITVMDAPDIHDWMKGNEFLITSGFVFKDDSQRFSSLLHKLKAKNVTALGIKINRFIKTLPDSVIETSNKLNLPIINIPDHYAFSDIINPGLTILVNDQYNELIRSQEIHNEFIKMGIHNTEIKTVLKRLKYFINKEVSFIDNKNDKIYSLSDSTFKNKVKISYENNKNTSEDNIYFHKVLDNQGLQGHIIVDCAYDQLTSLDLRTIEYAQNMIILHLQKDFSNKQVIKSYKDNFILDILLNNIKSDEEIINRAKIYSWELDSDMFCIIVDIDNYKLNYKSEDFELDIEKTRDSIHRDIIKMMLEINEDSYYMTKSDSIVYIVNYKKNDLSEFTSAINKIHKTIKRKYNYSLTTVIGNRYENVRDLHQSYKECLICLKFKDKNLFKINEDVIKYSDISIYWNLLKTLNENDYKSDPIVKKLVELWDSDKVNNTEYYETIKSIVRCDWNLKDSSREMFMHYNTIKYRFDRIKKLLNDDINTRKSKLKVELGLYMFEMLYDK